MTGPPELPRLPKLEQHEKPPEPPPEGREQREQRERARERAETRADRREALEQVGATSTAIRRTEGQPLAGLASALREVQSIPHPELRPESVALGGGVRVRIGPEQRAKLIDLLDREQLGGKGAAGDAPVQVGPVLLLRHPEQGSLRYTIPERVPEGAHVIHGNWVVRHGRTLEAHPRYPETHEAVRDAIVRNRPLFDRWGQRVEKDDPRVVRLVEANQRLNAWTEQHLERGASLSQARQAAWGDALHHLKSEVVESLKILIQSPMTPT